MSRIATALVVFGIAVAGCQSASSPSSPREALIDFQPLSPLVHQIYSGFREPAQFAVRDLEQWSDVWNRAFAAMAEIPPRPTVDFSSEMILVAAQGVRGSSGYDVSIDRIRSGDDGLIVDVTVTAPHRRCMVLTVVTSPVMMVRVPASSRIRFFEHTRTTSCE
jgi:hypothetical protein